MRIIHTSDWHLGQHFYGKSRADEHQQFLAWLIQQVKEKEVDAIIVAGDIFDTGTPPSYAREMYFEFINQINQLDCQLIVVAGNHDSVAMMSEAKSLLKSLNVHVIPMAMSVSHEQEKLEIEQRLNEQVFIIQSAKKDEQAVICGIPFIRPRDVMQSKAGQSSRDKQLTLQQAISEHYQLLYQHAQTLASNNLPIIATGHLTTVGVKTSESVRDIYIGTLDAFPANAFPDANYIALGHIHRSQKVAQTEHIRYCGSPIPLSFDEAKQDKNILMVTFDSQTDAALIPKIEPIVIPRFQALLMVKTNLEKLVTDVESAVDDCLQNKDLIDSSTQRTNEQQKIWVDIEIGSAEYLDDLNKRIEQLVVDLPVEILLVRRSKQARKMIVSTQDNTTLNELTVGDVFNERIALEDWQSEEELALQSRLKLIFQQVVAEVEHPELVEDDKVENNRNEALMNKSARTEIPDEHSSGVEAKL